jgi:hypothetical protein
MRSVDHEDTKEHAVLGDTGNKTENSAEQEEESKKRPERSSHLEIFHLSAMAPRADERRTLSLRKAADISVSYHSL